MKTRLQNCVLGKRRKLIQEFQILPNGFLLNYFCCNVRWNSGKLKWCSSPDKSKQLATKYTKWQKFTTHFWDGTFKNIFYEKTHKNVLYFCFWEQKASSSKSQGQEVSLQLTLCLYEPSSWLLALQGSQVQGNRVLFAVATCGTYYIPNLGATICGEATADNIHHAWFPISNSALITRQLWIYSKIPKTP